ncbi:hypothetical protein FH972_023272 [Carpinus fangiana]|uniref:Uncharacterized protein n=1 Tax=Carpinus fangiana TaxID=176857 RepID=A0A5N6KV46_9ROSI|nr:hypothetical protein FH972_023272 [Carpinus fangiana]
MERQRGHARYDMTSSKYIQERRVIFSNADPQHHLPYVHPPSSKHRGKTPQPSTVTNSRRPRRIPPQHLLAPAPKPQRHMPLAHLQGAGGDDDAAAGGEGEGLGGGGGGALGDVDDAADEAQRLVHDGADHVAEELGDVGLCQVDEGVMDEVGRCLVAGEHEDEGVAHDFVVGEHLRCLCARVAIGERFGRQAGAEAEGTHEVQRARILLLARADGVALGLPLGHDDDGLEIRQEQTQGLLVRHAVAGGNLIGLGGVFVRPGQGDAKACAGDDMQRETHGVFSDGVHGFVEPGGQHALGLGDALAEDQGIGPFDGMTLLPAPFGVNVVDPGGIDGGRQTLQKGQEQRMGDHPEHLPLVHGDNDVRQTRLFCSNNVSSYGLDCPQHVGGHERTSYQQREQDVEVEDANANARRGAG